MRSIVEAIYFFYSFGFVIARIVFVSIFGAFINEESQAGLSHLTSLPTEFYNEEVSFLLARINIYAFALQIQRLITQIHIDSVALTGHNLFRITKGLVLSVRTQRKHFKKSDFVFLRWQLPLSPTSWC
jgi:hypothetical protein